MEEEFYTDDWPENASMDSDFDSDLKRLLIVCKKITSTVTKAYFPQLFDELVEAVENMEVWYEHTDDPRENGWVDSKGRP